jgi:hypothetical protein
VTDKLTRDDLTEDQVERMFSHQIEVAVSAGSVVYARPWAASSTAATICRRAWTVHRARRLHPVRPPTPHAAQETR